MLQRDSADVENGSTRVVVPNPMRMGRKKVRASVSVISGFFKYIESSIIDLLA